MDATLELNWLQSLFIEMDITIMLPFCVWCDNLGANYVFVNSLFHTNIIHMATNYHFVREQTIDKRLLVKYVKLQD